MNVTKTAVYAAKYALTNAHTILTIMMKKVILSAVRKKTVLTANAA